MRQKHPSVITQNQLVLSDLLYIRSSKPSIRDITNKGDLPITGNHKQYWINAYCVDVHIYKMLVVSPCVESGLVLLLFGTNVKL